MMQTRTIVGEIRSQELVAGVASTLRRLEREAAGHQVDRDPSAAGRRLATFQRTLARVLQQAHLESVQELATG